ncbi:hypothetical protein F5B22DRAFT_565677 [Xylaria bambusicola]|uniref:uncharacterized protein n=1 Tax=Xylaria bambusicola TaxID=326684 RepID=UPI002007415C|nr:uncharacterized protein F5B22DRAFT_565677 [Xylaria bambusicola]KAI0521193.1 hypothetical protein F5B22DRAFT_565677 [Xylaria bambusicola]
MKLSATTSSLLAAATATTALAQSQCPIVWDDPRDEYGNPGYVNIDPYFGASGRKIILRPGCTYWRQNYPRDLPDETVGCLNEDGLVVPVSEENCATFNWIPATGELEDYFTSVIRTVKNNYICGTDYRLPNGGFGPDGRWTCQEEGWGYDLVDGPEGDVPIYPAGYTGGVISTQIFTWWIQHPPTSTADAQAMQWRVPDNPYSNYTLKEGDGTFPVIMELVEEI